MKCRTFDEIKEKVKLEQEIWLKAWVTIASCGNVNMEFCIRYADSCLNAFKERFFPGEDEEENKG